MTVNLLLVFIFLNVFIYKANSLECYTCVMTEEDMDQRCLTNPSQVQSGSAITNCNKNYCTSHRREYMSPKGKVASMYRGCEDNPTFKNEVKEDGTYRTYYRACKTNRCNDGNGKDISNEENEENKDSETVLYVPGIGKAPTLNPSLLTLVLLIFISFIY